MYTTKTTRKASQGVMLKHRILLYLLFLDEQPRKHGSMPFESTQDGIARTMGISRAH